jgi:alpha-tubulin suppressor-like RCC1 family protein
MVVRSTSSWSVAALSAIALACSGTAEPIPIPILTVTGVSPTNGPLAGGTDVTITGTFFPTNVDSVLVGGRRVSNLSRVSGTQLTGTTPAGADAGEVDIMLYGKGADNATCIGCFTYNPWGGSLTAGANHTCAMSSAGAAYCWGSNKDGQLGDGSNTTRYTPVAVEGGIAFASVAGGVGGNEEWGGHTCGLTADGVAYCWGLNQFGELGDNSTATRSMPVAVVGGVTFESLTLGVWHTCGLSPNGAAYCWGNNFWGQLGDGSLDPSRAPVSVAGEITFARLAAGDYHTCGLTTSGAVYCWGANYYGQLGNGSVTDSLPTATLVPGGITFAALTAGSGYTCAVASDGRAYCWGANYYRQLGDATTGFFRPTPGPAVPDVTFVSLEAGLKHTCGVTGTGRVHCWGANHVGQLGNSMASEYGPTAVAPVPHAQAFTMVTAGANHSCGLTSGGALYCWGSNFDGQLGDGSSARRNTPVAVANP